MPDRLHLLRCSRTEFAVVRTLSSDEAMVYRGALTHLREFDKSPAYLELVARNHVELDEEFALWLSSAERIHKDAAFRDHQEIETNRRLVNYLSSARLLLDHYEMRLKRRYGDNSTEAVGFKTECSASYDAHFAYRFLYRLRNFAQHFGMPAGHVEARGALGHPGSPTVQYEASILIDVNDLLARGGDIWGPVATELSALGPLVDVRPHVATMTKELNRIVTQTQLLEKPKLTAVAQTIADIMRDAIGPGLTPGVALITNTPPKGTLQFIQPPFRLLQWLGFTGFDTAL